MFMSKFLKKKQILSLILVVTMILSVLAPIVSAVQIDDVIDTTRKASLTIVKYENAYGEGKNPDDNIPLKDVTFTIYKLDDVNHDRPAEDIYNEFNPEDIVMSAGAWDSELVTWFGDVILAKHDIKAVITNDGAIVFDPALIKRA